MKFSVKPIKRFDLKRALFILPNAFTLASIFCGMYAIIYSLSHSGPDALYRAAMAIFLAGLFDMFDGMAARKFNQSTDFGAVLDMVCDRASDAVILAILGSLYP